MGRQNEQIIPLSMLRCAIMEYKKNWDELLLNMEMFYNAKVHESTKISPHEIVYGTKLSSPADRLTGQSTEAISTESIKLYIEKM